MITMHDRMQWKEIGIEAKLAVLRNDLVRAAESASPEDADGREKMHRWIGMVDGIVERIKGIEDTVRPAIEKDIGHELGGREMLILAMFQPSTRNLFDEVETHRRIHGGWALSREDLQAMAGIAAAAETLAWIGDAALKIGVMPEIWDSDLSKAGVLTERRKRYERNSNQAVLADRWRLYEYRIHFDPESRRNVRRMNHDKATLVESVFGILFLNGGMKDVGRAARLLRPQQHPQS
jgi:23S rRNA maturation mini-RNase III